MSDLVHVNPAAMDVALPCSGPTTDITHLFGSYVTLCPDGAGGLWSTIRITVPPSASIGDVNAGCAPAPLEQGAAPCRDAVSNTFSLSPTA